MMRHKFKARQARYMAAAIVAVMVPVTVLGGLALGSVKYSAPDTLSCFLGSCQDRVMEDIVWKIRAPRTLAALMGGAGLATAGALLQALFRNPLASPSILGISSGASLGVALLVIGGISIGIPVHAFGVQSVFVAAFAGALATMFVIMAIIPRATNTTTLLLVGLMINALLLSIIGILAVMAQAADLQVFYTWTLGSFAGITWDMLNYLYIIVPLAIAGSYAMSKSLDASLLGEGYATSIGVKAGQLRNRAVLLSSALTSTITAIAGPVGFIGIAGPYLARLMSHSGMHRVIIPLSAVIGGLLTAGADILARIVIPPVDLPTSSITSIIGAPLVIMILLKRKGEGLSQ